MLELRPVCEICAKSLPPDSTEAMICTYECTFCKDCVDNLLQNVCPNCGGGFVPRPIRPKEELLARPAKTEPFTQALNKERHAAYLKKYLDVKPENR